MVSMVVDWLDAHPYQAEVLLATLEEVGRCPASSNGRAMHGSGAGRGHRRAFRRRGHVVVVIEPYLDRTYCNKIAQLDHFLTAAKASLPTADGVLLLDLDIAVLAPLVIPDSDAVCGKVVDGPNPPLAATLSRCSAKAGVALPDVIPCDWRERGKTIATNLNGGVHIHPAPAGGGRA